MTAMKVSPLGTSTPRIRIPFFWWQHEATATTARAAESDYLRTDTDYIPTGTADMWRSSRRRVA